MPVDSVEYFRAWCDECEWEDNDCDSYEAALTMLDDHIRETH